MHKEQKFKEGFVESDKVKLQYFDWGGKGDVLVMLPGLGDTPFLFEDLADQLSPKLRIISYARRAHGKSIAKEEKYDTDALTSDLKLLLDSLNIHRADLLGWSLGGNEITEFALRYPNRVNKLIYFEAGYDMSDGGFERLMKSVPKSFLADSSTLKSLDGYKTWYHRFWFGDTKWNEALENNLHASVHVNQDGSVMTIPNDDVFRTFLKEAIGYRRKYKDINAASLVVYAKPYFFPADNNDNSIALYDSLESKIISPWRASNKQRVKEELRNAVIVDAPAGTHTSFLFLSHDYLGKTISAFLESK